MTEATFRSDMTVRLLDYSGSDSDICQAARVSTLGAQSEEFTDPTRNDGLINFLMREKHGSPFEHNSMTFLIEAPIFVFREFHRHRIGWSYNEVSGRYSEMQPVFYVPADDRNLVQQGKPGAYAFTAGSDTQHFVTQMALRVAAKEAYAQYLAMLREGVAREVARMCLPVHLYSAMYATCNARSLMAFLSLRTHRKDAAHVSHPMREIEMVAELLEDAFSGLFPASWTAYNQHKRVAP